MNEVEIVGILRVAVIGYPSFAYTWPLALNELARTTCDHSPLVNSEN